jgi:RsiW-degrading membrane proteinase PrsW (M82 family)
MQDYSIIHAGVLSTLLSLCVIFWERHLVDMNPWALSVTLVIGGFLVLILLSVSMQPVSSEHLTFKVQHSVLCIIILIN